MNNLIDWQRFKSRLGTIWCHLIHPSKKIHDKASSQNLHHVLK